MYLIFSFPAGDPPPFSPLYFHLPLRWLFYAWFMPHSEALNHPVPRRRHYPSCLHMKVLIIHSVHGQMHLSRPSNVIHNDGRFTTASSPPRHRWCSVSKRHITEIKIYLLTIVVPFHRRQQQHRPPLLSVASASLLFSHWQISLLFPYHYIWSERSERWRGRIFDCIGCWIIKFGDSLFSIF